MLKDDLEKIPTKEKGVLIKADKITNVSLEGPQRNYFHFTHFKALCLTYGDLMV
jgi:hypothetical protein